MAQYFLEFNLAEKKFSDEFLFFFSCIEQLSWSCKLDNFEKNIIQNVTHLLAHGGTSVRLGPR